MFSFFSDPINEFVQSHSLAVLATVDAHGAPHTSTIFYISTGKNHIDFVTKAQTRKSQNLTDNSTAALTITDLQGPVAVNMTGRAHEVTASDERDSALQALGQTADKAVGDYAPILKTHKGGFRVFRFTPTHATLTDFSKPHQTVAEKSKDY